MPGIIIALSGLGLGLFFIRQKIQKETQRRIESFQEKIPLCQDFFRKLGELQHKYLTGSEIKALENQWLNAEAELAPLRPTKKFHHFELYQQFKSYETDVKNSFKAKNQSYMEQELVKYQSLFDSVEGKSLTAEQRKIAVCIDDNNLVVASAGSGKTLTIIANILYLIKKGINPQDILVLSFNKKIAEEIKERFLILGLEIKASTFHGLGMEILKKSQEKPTYVFDENDEKEFQAQFLNEVLYDDALRDEVLKYFACYLYPLPSISHFEDLGAYLRQTSHMDMETLKSHWKDKYEDSRHIETLQGERVKSLGELVIANYLFLNGIEYEYEKPYPTQQFAYKPDFYLTEYDIWLEHFGVIRKPNGVLQGMTDSYVAEMHQKQKLHTQNNTTLMSTYFYEFMDEDFWDILTTRLKEKGVKSQKPNIEKLQQNIEAIREKMPFRSFLKNLSTFLSLFKGHGEKTLEGIQKEITADRGLSPYLYQRNLLFFNIFKRYLGQYEDYLKANEKIDFNDMLTKAISLARHTHPYKYLYVDEYQDTSLLRFRFIEKIVQEYKSTLTVIGDDWQSIYRFAGSNINLFTHFGGYVNGMSRFDLSQTYRYSLELAELSAEFITRNPEQFTKKVRSEKSLKNPVIVAEYSEFTDTLAEDSLYTRFISVLEQVLDKKPEIKAVLILGRNNSDLKNSGLLGGMAFTLKGHQTFSQPSAKLAHHAFPGLDFEFRTVHRAKGSEADLVFVLNNNNSMAGFPNKMESDPVFKYIIDDSEGYPYAEERRLFYVALTRTKTYTILMASYKNPSEFIEEIRNSPHVKVLGINAAAPISHRCPYCKSGRIILKQNRQTKEFYGDCEFQGCPGNSRLGSAVLVDNEYVKCPSCGGIMMERINKSTGEKFFGCSNYNTGLCKKTMSVKSEYNTVNQNIENYTKQIAEKI